MTWQAYNDAAARAVFLAFKERLEPLMEQVAPDWMLHHMKLIRRPGSLDPFDECVEIRLVIKPIGSARVVDTDADLRIGPLRITHRSAA